MKRTLTLLAFIVTTTLTVFAQSKTKTQSTTTTSEEDTHSYLGLSTGINNISGVAGLTFETPFSENFSGKVGLGIGSWGYKFGLAAKYYKQYASSWSFGAGYSSASGARELPLQLTRAATPNTNENIKMNLDRAHMVDFVAGKAWGKKVKFSLELGYSLKVAGGKAATVDKTVVLSETSTKALNLVSPGGLIIGLGLLFRL